MGRQVHVLGTEHLGGEWAPVVRMTLDTDDDARGPTVIVKTWRFGGTGWGYDPANLRNEEASLRLLGSLDSAVAPGVIAADDAAGVLVMTDLGAGPTVEQLVYGDDAGAARNALTAMARSTGVMHARTRGKGGAYSALRAPLGPVDPAHQMQLGISLDTWDECGSVMRTNNHTTHAGAGRSCSTPSRRSSPRRNRRGNSLGWSPGSTISPARCDNDGPPPG